MTTVREQAAQFFNNPGQLYNGGNYLAAAISVEQFAISFLHSSASGWNLIAATLIGASTVAFYIGGKKYESAWAKGFPPHIEDNKGGHRLSAYGAAALGCGLTAIGGSQNFILAATSGFMHAFGKFGSTFTDTTESFRNTSKSLASRLCKDAVLVSRLPAMVAVAHDFYQAWRDLTPADATITSLPLLTFSIAYALWARADMTLMRDGQSWLLPQVQRLTQRFIPVLSK
jgi:hypothetical protein